MLNCPDGAHPDQAVHERDVALDRADHVADPENPRAALREVQPSA
jgi:hypothetical protein